ncbi:MAG TPA: gamma-glutamyl-gamma-aminobutyrate hydrolase family protein [Herpetosiphonaceae bacterium]|nr:gamma-glutamyl-gamma-aminobutyrate hydrolase family protein [Herpetosiphonaceae bacterium]
MTPPLIGITTHAPTAPDRATLDQLLAQIWGAVAAAGGLPVLIPPGLSTATLWGVFARLDGLLLSGGGDIDPSCYGASPAALVSGVDGVRDRVELDLAHWALDEGKPVLGICRGLQVLNVAGGGTLYRDIGKHPGVHRHTYYPGYPFDLLAHPVEIAVGSRLAHVVGRTTLMVNSLHHQACQAIAPGLHAVARAPDGLIEALEAPEHPFALGVQWHPETLPGLVEMQALFRAIVAASAQRAGVALA